MRLLLSDKAAQQLGYTENADKPQKEKPGLSPEELAREAQKQAKLREKQEAKARKVAARDAAQLAETVLQNALASLNETETSIARAQNRLANDQKEHRKREERARDHLLELQRKLERLHTEMMEAQAALTHVRQDVPASIAGMDALTEERDNKLVLLQEAFNKAEDAFKSPDLSNSQKGKRDKSLRRAVRGLLNG